MSISAIKQALEALEKLWDIIDDIDTYGDMAKSDDKLYRSLVERRQRQRFEQTGISTDGYELNGGAITTLRQAIAEAEKQEPVGEIVHAFSDLVSVSIPKMPPVGTKLYTEPPKREWENVTDDALIEEVRRRGFTIRDAQIGVNGKDWNEIQCQCGHKMYVKHTGREWVALSDEDYEELLNSNDWGGSLIYAVEKKLMEKNT
jgi:hypothetical protein